MKLVNNNLSPLPFYDDLKYQNHRKAYAFGAIYPLRTYENFLLPFQAVLTSGTTADITAVTLHNFSTGTSTDITAAIKEAGLTLTSHEGFSILSYPAISALSAISQEGLYYLSISITGLGTIYSDIFSSSNNVDDCLLLEYSNSYNLEFNGGIVDFSDDFRFKCYISSQIGRPEYPFEEQVTERMGFSFVETQVSKKVYKFTFLAPEYLCDALRIVRLCDNKKIVNAGLTYDLTSFSMNPEWEEQGDLAAVECEFETDTVIANLGGYTPTIPGEGTVGGGGVGGVSNVEWGTENIPQAVSLAVNEVAKTLSLSGHDHTKENINPDKITVGTVEITCVDGRLHVSSTVTSDGDFVAFGDEEGGTGSGGLDIARMWEELEAEGTEQIHVSHLTDALGGKADKATTLKGYGIKDAYTKNEIDGELAKYVTIAGNQDITGVKTFTNGIKIGSITLSAVDGRLHVSSTVTSDGDFVAFGDEEGGTGSGGLDIARMWEELEAEGTEQIHVSHLTDALGDKADKATTLEGYGIKDAYTKTQIDEELAKYVTIAGNQDITGVKTFTNGIKIGSITLSAVDGRLHVSSTVTSDGDFVAFGDEEGGTGSGGLDIARMWEELEAEGTEQIHVSHLTDALSGYATQDYVNNRINDLINGAPAAYDTLKEIADVLEGNVDSIGDILTALGGKADKATTLAGYGIKDAYTKTEIDGELAKYVTLAGNQDVTGVKTFVNGIKIGSISLSVVDGRLHVSSTVTSDGDFVAFGDEEGGTGSGGLDVDMLWEELGGSVSSKVIDLSHIPAIPRSKITGLDNALASYATRTWVQQQGYLTSVPAATSSAYGGIKIGYPESGKNYPVELDSSGRAYVNVPWVNTTYSLSSFGITATAAEINKLDGVGTLLHSGNIGSYALTPSNYTSYLDSRYVNVSGDTMTGVLQFPDNVASIGMPTIKFGSLGQIGCDTAYGSWLQYGSNSIHVTNSGPKYNNTYTVWHSGNDGSGSGLDADTVDGVHNGSLSAKILLSQGRVAAMTSGAVMAGVQMVEVYQNGYPCGYGNALRIGGAHTPGAGELVLGWSGSNGEIEHLYYHNKRDQYSGWSEWRTIAFTTDNVASATKLATARSLWGNSFDGGQDITGRIYAFNGISAPYGPGMWIDMARRADVIMADRNNSTQSAHALYRAKDSNGNAIVFGGLGVHIGFFGFTASRISSAANGFDWSTVWDVGNGSLGHSGSLSVAGQLTAGGNVIAYSSSSRLVKDILPAVSYSRRLKSLGRVVEYRYNGLIDRDRDIHTGLLYENVRDIMPSMCFMHDGYGALNYLDKDYICTIAGAVQENIDDIMYLKNKVASLEAEVARLRRGLAA